MASLWRIKRLERSASDLDSYLAKDGTRVFFDWNSVGSELFTHLVKLWTLDEDEDEPLRPEPVRRILEEAQDPYSVLERFRPEGTTEAGRMFDPLLLLAESREDRS